MSSTRARAIFVATIMVISVVGMTAAFAGSAAAQQEITVDNFSDFEDNVTGSGTASSGDTVVVETGTYSTDGLSVGVNNLTIRAADGQNPKITISNNNQFIITANNVTVRGLDISRSNDGNSLVSAKGDSPTIEDNEFEGGPLAVSGSDDISLINNTIVGTNPANGHGIFLTSPANDVVIEQNNLSGWDAPSNELADIYIVASIDSLNGNNELRAGALAVQSTNTDLNSTHLEAAKLTTLRPSATISDAVDRSSKGYTIIAESGTYQESVTVDTPVTIDGAGSSSSGTVLNGSGSGTGITVSASNVTVQNLRITDYSNGIKPNGDISDITFENVYSGENGARGMSIPGGADIQDLSLNNVEFNNNTGDGIRASTASKVDGFTVQNSHFDNNSGDPASSGIEIYQNEETPGQFTNVSIKDTTFNNNGDKGIYTEKLSNAVLDNITVDGVNNNEYGFNTGIDINLKYSDYQNITIKNSDVRNVSQGSPSDPSFSAAIAVKARDDGRYSGSPATLDDVTLNTVTVEDSFNGLRIGEATVDYSGSPSGPTNVTVTNSAFRNNERYHIEDLPGSINLETVETGNTFDRTVSSKLGIYSSIQASVDTAESGDIIEVGPGMYEESVAIATQNVTLEGPNAGTPGYESRPSNEAVIQQGVNISADEVTLDGFEVTNNGGNGIKLSVAPSDVVITNNRVVDIAGGTAGDQKAFANGINLQFNKAFKETSSGIELTNNEIANVTTEDMDSYSNDAIGIQLLPRGNDVEDLRIADNVIRDVEPGDASDNGRAEARGISVDTQFVDQPNGDTRGNYGQATNLTIQNNEIYNLTSEYSRAISVFEDKGGSSNNPGANIGPVNFTIASNTIDRITSEDPANNVNQPPTALFVGGYENLGEEHQFSKNNVKEGVVSRVLYGHVDAGSADTLDATKNWWETDRGPTASSETAVVGKVAYDPFLTTPKENIEVDDVGETQRFAQDISAPADQDITVVGFPGPVPDGYTVGEAFDNFNGTIYEYSIENDQFTAVTDGSREIGSLDAFVIVQNQDETLREDVQVVIEYANVPDNAVGQPDSKTIEPGFNLIAPRGLGDSYDVFNAPSDREVIYGTYELPARQPALLPTESADSEFVESTFGSNEDDPVVTPYGGYLVFTEEQRTITTNVQTGVTADEILDDENLNRTGA